MFYRDAEGHSISEEEARRLGIAGVEEDEEEVEEVVVPHFGDAARAEASMVFIETGRGNTAEAAVGAPFGGTVERVAEQANYGGYFRVFLNGSELLNPEEAPETIQPGQRIAITSYDKVG